MMSSLTAILGFLSGIWSFATKVFDYLKEQALIATGRSLEQGDLAKQEAELTRTTSEIIAEEKPREKVIKEMRDGTF